MKEGSSKEWTQSWHFRILSKPWNEWNEVFAQIKDNEDQKSNQWTPRGDRMEWTEIEHPWLWSWTSLDERKKSGKIGRQQKITRHFSKQKLLFWFKLCNFPELFNTFQGLWRAYRSMSPFFNNVGYKRLDELLKALHFLPCATISTNEDVLSSRSLSQCWFPEDCDYLFLGEEENLLFWQKGLNIVLR